LSLKDFSLKRKFLFSKNVPKFFIVFLEKVLHFKKMRFCFIFWIFLFIKVNGQCKREVMNANTVLEDIGKIFGCGLASAVGLQSLCKDTTPYSQCTFKSEKIDDRCYSLPKSMSWSCKDTLCSYLTCDDYGYGPKYDDKVTYCEKTIEEYVRKHDTSCIWKESLERKLSYSGCCPTDLTCNPGFEIAIGCKCAKYKRFNKIFYNRVLLNSWCQDPNQQAYKGQCFDVCTKPGTVLYRGKCTQACVGHYTYECGSLCVENLSECILLITDITAGALGVGMDLFLFIGSAFVDVGAGISAVGGGTNLAATIFMNESLHFFIRGERIKELKSRFF